MEKKTLVLALALFGSAQVDPKNTIYQNLAFIPSTSTLYAVLSDPNYKPVMDALNSPGTITLFAPNNAAFDAAKIDTTNVPLVTDVLLYHALGATVKSTDLAPQQFPRTLLTDPKYVTLKGLGQVVDVTSNSNGVFTNWGLPGNASQTAQVVIADVICSNGVIHVISAVQMIPLDVATTCQNAGLTTLLNAVVKAGLVSAVTTTPQITIFAPTNQAFINAGIDPNQLTPDQLTPVLTYHVVPATAFSVDLSDKQVLPTLQGETLTISITAGGVQVIDSKGNAANVIAANVIVQNGAVHVIDRVLLP